MRVALVLVVFLAFAQAASAAPWRSAASTPIEPPYAAGEDGSGTMVARVRAPGSSRVYALAAFEKHDVPVWPAGTIGDCFAYGEEEGLRSFVPMHWGMTCVPRADDELRVAYGHYGRVSVERYRARRRSHRRLPGVTVIAGRAGAGVRRVIVRGPGARRRIALANSAGGFLVAWRGWLESESVTVRGKGTRRAFRVRFGRAEVRSYSGAPPTVIPPYTEALPLR